MATKKQPVQKPREEAPVDAPRKDRADVPPTAPADAPKDSAVSSLESDIKKEGFEAEAWYDEGANLVYARATNDKGHARLLSLTPAELDDNDLKKTFVSRLTSEV